MIGSFLSDVFIVTWVHFFAVSPRAPRRVNIFWKRTLVGDRNTTIFSQRERSYFSAVSSRLFDSGGKTVKSENERLIENAACFLIRLST